jgi:hypothetical protein
VAVVVGFEVVALFALLSLLFAVPGRPVISTSCPTCGARSVALFSVQVIAMSLIGARAALVAEAVPVALDVVPVVPVVPVAPVADELRSAVDPGCELAPALLVPVPAAAGVLIRALRSS